MLSIIFSEVQNNNFEHTSDIQKKKILKLAFGIIKKSFSDLENKLNEEKKQNVYNNSNNVKIDFNTTIEYQKYFNQVKVIENNYLLKIADLLEEFNKIIHNVNNKNLEWEK